MRENRTCGSEGGESGQPDFPTPIRNASQRWPMGLTACRGVAESRSHISEFLALERRPPDAELGLAKSM